METIVTVTDEKYIAGTQVLLYSFLKHHPNYKGDFLVIHNQLSQQLQDELTAHFSVKFEQISEELMAKLTELSVACPQLRNKLQRFWSLELFRLDRYTKLLFLDSDILCRGNLDELLQLDQAFTASADLSYYREKMRDKSTFEFTPLNKQEGSGTFKQTFNSGVMLVNLSKNPKSIYSDVLNLLNPDNFSKVTSGHTDQFVLNKYFENKTHWIDARFNYILREEKFILDKTGISSEEAKLWHYIRNPKPWNFKKLIKNGLKRKPIPSVVKEWQKVYKEMLIKQNKLSIGKWIYLSSSNFFKEK